MATAIHGSPEPKKAGEFPDWVLLDRVGRIHCYDNKDAAAAAVGDDATAVAVDTTTDHSGYFSFTLRPPPRVSFLDLHWPYGVPESVLGFPAYPAVVSADGDLALLSIVILGLPYFYSHPDMFVYAAGCASSPPLQRRLPACAKKAQDVAGRDRFLRTETDIGILCRGGGGEDDDDYVVVDLIVSLEAGGNPVADINSSPVVAVLCAFSSRTGEWTINEMQGQFPMLWDCDRVLPFAGHFLCWVDYYNGVLALRPIQ